jgi:dihydrofolate synthase/folylpolyglutamate synthase
VGAFLSTVLKEAGYRVGFYTSPHLVRFTERFKINNEEIRRDEAAELIRELRQTIVRQEPPTFFEATTAMALKYFAQKHTDIAVMETGMGGRLDATNVITPLVSVITNISLEHQIFLGKRLLAIAREKAGIIKNGIDVVTGVTQPAVIDFMRSTCMEKRAPMWRLGRDFRYRWSQRGFHYSGMDHRIGRLQLGIGGRIQGRNAALAMAALEILRGKGFAVSSRAVREGLNKAVWPGRMHVLSTRPILLLDGAHNPAAIRTLAAAIKKEWRYKRLILVLGIMEDKDIGAMVRGIVPLAHYTLYTRPVYPRAAEPDRLMAEAAHLNGKGEVEPSLMGALQKARAMADPEDMIVVCGSLFTVGEALSHLDPKRFRPDTL